MKRTRLLPPAVVLLVAVAGGLVLVRYSRSPDPPQVSDVTASVASRPAERTVPSGRLVISELRGAETILLSVSPANPEDRRPVARIEHAPNWAPRAAIAPGGDLIAYTVLPAGARSPDTEGTLWVVALQAREPRRLTMRIDARVAPVWAPDGSRVVYQRAIPGGPASLTLLLEEVNVRDGKAQELAQVALPARLFPIGYAPEGEGFYYVRFAREGAYLHEVDTRSRAVRQVTRLGDGAARDFKLSPYGSALLYLALDGASARYRAFRADMRTGDTRPLLEGLLRSEDVGVAWRPGTPASPAVGMITVPGAQGTGPGTRGTSGGETTARVALDEGGGVTVTERAGGFDVPVAWSPDGRYLALRAFSGAGADDPGREQPVLLDREGVRTPLRGTGTVELVGWVTDAP